MPDPRDLRLFVCLAEELHFARAADRLGLAQSSLSVRLQRLEDIVGAPLFDRHKRAAVQLTEVGSVLLPEAKDTLARMARFEAIGRMAARGEVGTLHLGYIFSAAMNGMLGTVLSALRSEGAFIDPQARLLDTPSQLRAIADRTIDLGLCRPRPLYPANVEARTIHREPLGLLMRHDHRLATSTIVAAKELEAETFLLPQFNERFGLVEKLDRLAITGGFPPPDPVRTHDFVTAASMAAAGYGIVLGPRSLIGLGIDALRFVPVADFGEAIETALIWHQKTSRFIRTLVEQIAAADGTPAEDGAPFPSSRFKPAP